MGNITKSLWHLVTDAVNEAAPAPTDRIPIAQQPGVSYVTEWSYVTVAALLGLIPPASVVVRDGLAGDGTAGNPIDVLVDGLTVFVDPITNELEAAVIVQDGLTGDSLNTPLSVLVDGTTIEIDAITNELQVIGGSGAGGNSIYSTAFGAEPGSPNAGDADFYTNAPQIARYEGSWQPYGPVWKFTAPVSGDFAWINQGGAAISTVHGGVLLYTAAAGGDHWRIRKKAAPGTPYFIVVGFIPHIHTAAFQRVGFFWRQSSDGALIGVNMNGASSAPGGGATWQTTRMNNDNSYSAETNFSAGHAFFAPDIRWIQISDDGANRKAWISNDGFLWTEKYSEGRTTFLTANEVGYFVDPNNASNAIGMHLLHWSQHVTFQGIATP